MPELDERWTVSGWNRWVCHEGVVCLSANELCQDLLPLEPVWKEVQLMAWSLQSSLEIGTPLGLDSIDIVIGKQRYTSWWWSAQNRSVLLFHLNQIGTSECLLNPLEAHIYLGRSSQKGWKVWNTWSRRNKTSEASIDVRHNACQNVTM